MPGQAADESRGQLLAALLLGLGLVMLGCGILKIFAGVRNRKFRNRGLGFVALISAVPAVFTCWCAPTGLAIMAYGLIAYTRPEGRAAFDAAETSLAGQSLGLR